MTTKRNEIKTDGNLEKIANMLLLNGSLLESSGLWYGQMGVAVFFFHYARHTGNDLFEDYAVEIIGQIRKEIHKDSPAEYGKGIAGIGAGIQYLAENDFLDIDTDVILEDFDNRICRDIMYIPQDNNSLSDGLTGLGQYLLFRIRHPQKTGDEIRLLTNREMMIHIVNILEHTFNPADQHLPDVLSFLCRLHQLNLCNPKIERCISTFQDSFSADTVPAENQPDLALALTRMALVYPSMAKAAEQSVEQLVQIISRTGTLQEKGMEPDDPRTLLWLSRCKRIIRQTEIGTGLIPQLDALIDKRMAQLAEIRFECSKLSLIGCAGTGLALMTMNNQIEDTWIDLLG